MRLPTVCLDVDGVVADFYAGVRDELVRAASILERNSPARPEGWRDLDANHARLVTETATQYDGPWDDALEAWLWPRVDASHDWWKGVPQLACVAARKPQLRFLLMQLKLAADVLWVTSRHSGASPVGQQTQQWLRACGLDDRPNVVACEGSAHKIAVLRALKPIAMVEDNPTILNAMALGDSLTLRYAPPWPYCSGLRGVRTMPLEHALGDILTRLEVRCRTTTS